MEPMTPDNTDHPSQHEGMRLVNVESVSSLPPESWGDGTKREGVADPKDETKQATNAALFKLFRDMHTHCLQCIEAARRSGAREGDLAHAQTLIDRAVGAMNRSLDL